ncbi:alpha/beta fold hydrolase [Cylindrospermopsis raciborskii]|uniref:Alpha/beta hydrolase n=1 Tax=Cylindrospermopsis raciborskii CS-505 TaxID=533240 RepID=A0A853MDX6_9CYAN|nr:alpha/beta hydrolase [Cylindrospermopsis raciborskii]OBU77129.1 alpha/beta hydrolase [Cylindrospermopsis raciborskii CS-505]
MPYTTLFRNSRIKLPQGLLFWHEIGEGIPIIFLHGPWNDGSQWTQVMSLIADKFHCFAPDLLGFGTSANPNVHHSISLQVECLNEFVKALKLKRFYLAGDSLGAWIATSYALKYPDHIISLLLLQPEGIKTDKLEPTCSSMRRLANTPSLLFAVFKCLDKRFNPIIRILGWQNKINKYLELHRKFSEYPTACQLLFNRKFREIDSELLGNNLVNLELPCLILQGGQDERENLEKSKTYASMIYQSQLKIITHGTNNLPQNCTGVVAQYILDFFTV